MYEKIDFKLQIANFFASLKGFITVCFIFAIAFYMFAYVFPKSDFTESERIYNHLKEIAYNEAEKRNTDYELTDVLREYEISTGEDGFKNVTLIGKGNVNFKFYLSDEYEVIETVESWKISTATTVFAQILTSVLIGVFGGIIIYFMLCGLDIILTSIGCYKDTKK